MDEEPNFHELAKPGRVMVGKILMWVGVVGFGSLFLLGCLIAIGHSIWQSIFGGLQPGFNMIWF